MQTALWYAQDPWLKLQHEGKKEELNSQQETEPWSLTLEACTVDSTFNVLPRGLQQVFTHRVSVLNRGHTTRLFCWPDFQLCSRKMPLVS